MSSRWLVPALVADLRERAPGVRLRVNEGASERLFGELVDGELAQAVVTEPVNDRRLAVGRTDPAGHEGGDRHGRRLRAAEATSV